MTWVIFIIVDNTHPLWHKAESERAVLVEAKAVATLCIFKKNILTEQYTTF